MTDDLFAGRLIRLSAMDAEASAEWFARWDRDVEYMRLLDSDPHRLMTAKQIKAAIEKDEAESQEIQFAIRTLAEDRLIGFVALDGINWPHGDSFVGIGIGDRAYWGKGYGTDAMRVLLRYAFTELNLSRLSLNVFSYNQRAIRSYEKAGFVVEGRQRQALQRDGQYHDLIFMGVLRDDWRRTINNEQ
ncbi:MAG: GNAT family N-acetyltransferase [Thermoflexales bacterium]|nr:GNAT family N-acetyltransferase [Thermoflexales bacterium]